MPYKDKEKAKKYLREYHEKRRDFVRRLKEVPCTDCGVEYPHYVMDFDHVRGEKIGNINVLRTRRSIESLMDEIDKCEIVCANCHRVRTFERYQLE